MNRSTSGRKLQPSVPVPDDGGTLDYGRHFAWLSCISVALVASSRWRPSLGIAVSFALYGALHSSMVVIALRTVRAAWKKVLFVAISASLGAFWVWMSFYASRLLGALPGAMGPELLVITASALGAVAYASTVRAFWMPYFSPSSILAAALGCIVSTLGVIVSRIHLHTDGALWLAIAWWFAFSLGLWRRDGHDRRQNAIPA